MGNEQTMNVVLAASAAILKTGSGVGEIIGVPGVKQTSDLLLVFIHAIQNMKGNEAKRVEISTHIQALARIVADIQEKVSRNRNAYSRALEDRVMQLNSELVQYGQVTSRLVAMRAPERLLRNQEISDTLADLSNGLKMSCERTNTRALFDIEANQAHQGQAVDKIHEGVERILKSSKAEVDPFTLLPFANAAYDSINVDNKCEVLPGTRLTVMDRIDKWAAASGQKQVFWLRGAAGTGKSTIAKSVADKFKKAKRLGASFFFLRGVQDLGDSRLLITTIACHLARLDGPVGTAIKNAAREYQSTETPGEKSSWRQFTDLLHKPLEHITSRVEPIIIVIDALDEASDRVAVVSTLARLARQLVTLPVNIKLFVTSRPDPQIESVLGGASLLVLHDIEKTILDHDIKIYIENVFREMQDSGRGFQYAPQDIQSLVDQCGGLFIYVSTVIHLLNDSIDPSRALRGIFKRKSDRMLDQLYLQVLQRAFGGHDGSNETPEDREAWDERLRVISTTVLSQDRHSCSTLAALLDSSTTAIRDALSHLGAVILLPQDDDLPVRIIHASFADFIVDAERCTNPQFAIQTTDHHSFLAEQCLHHMNHLLVENPCKILDPYALNSDIPDLDERINQFLPLHLQYASRSWAYHLSLSAYSTSLKEQLRVFCKTHLLEWLEVMSLFGRADLATAQLDTILKWLKSNEALPSAPKSSLLARMETLSRQAAEQVLDEVSMLLYDAYRFTLQFADSIIASARHIYVSALPLMPSCLLYRIYRTRIPNTAVKVSLRRDIAWRPYLRTLSGHSASVVVIASSKDGAHVVSGSRDNTLLLWDSYTGAQLAQYLIKSPPRSVAFSADGAHVIASTVLDIHVWNWSTGDSSHWSTGVQSGEEYDRLSWDLDKGCGENVAVSNISSRFATCASRGDIRVWDVTGRQLNLLKGHSSWVSCIAFSPDDSQIVSASEDRTMCLWDSNGKQLMKFHQLQDLVKFSPDGRKIFSTSKNRICVWDAQTGDKLSQTKFPSQWMVHLRFSLDRTRLATVNYDGDIRVFDSFSGACTFDGRCSGRIDALQRIKMVSVAFSPDGTRLFSGLTDRTIRIWDLSVNYKLDLSKQEHWSDIEGIAFSPDGTRICTWGMDKNHIHVWDLSTGCILIELKGHTRPVLSTAFSPDSTHILSGSSDATIRIWDSSNGRQVKKLTIQRGFCRPLSVAISPDGTRVACGLYPEILHNEPHVWDVLKEIQSRPRSGSTAITFSPDGSHVYSVLSSPLDVVQWDTKSGKIISRGEVPYNQTVLGQVPLLKMQSPWIVPVRDPSRKLFCIPVTYLPLRNFYTYGLFVVLVGPDNFAIFDFSHMSSLISH